MALSMHSLKPAKGAKRYPKRVGRGNATGKGTTAGRGGKGQTARTGGRNRLKLLGMRHLMLQTPKLRGFQSLSGKAATVTLDRLDEAFESGATVNPRALAKKGLIPAGEKRVKILAGGSLKKKLTVTGCALSAGAKEKIAAAGGTVR